MRTTLSILSIVALLSSCNQPEKTTEGITKDKTEIILPVQSQCELLIPDSIIPKEASIFLDALGMPCLLLDSIIFYLEYNGQDDFEMPMIFFNSVIPNEIICFDDGTIWFSENHFLKQIEDEESKTMLEFPAGFHIEKAEEAGVYVSTYDSINKRSNLYFVNKDEMTAHKMLSDSLPIIVSGYGDVTAVALGKSIYLLHNGESELLFLTQEPVKQLAFSPHGIFYATENAVWYLDPEINIPFLKKGVRQMLSFENQLYLLLKDGALYKITNTEYFNQLSELFTN